MFFSQVSIFSFLSRYKIWDLKFLFKMCRTAVVIIHWKQDWIMKLLQERCIWLKGCHLEGNSINEAHIIQPSCSKQGYFQVRSGCSGSCPVDLWLSPNVEIAQVLGNLSQCLNTLILDFFSLSLSFSLANRES